MYFYCIRFYCIFLYVYVYFLIIMYVYHYKKIVSIHVVLYARRMLFTCHVTTYVLCPPWICMNFDFTKSKIIKKQTIDSTLYPSDFVWTLISTCQHNKQLIHSTLFPTEIRIKFISRCLLWNTTNSWYCIVNCYGMK